MLDVDGTIIPYDKNALPSQRVTDAINKAGKYIHVGVATSRPAFMLAHIIDHLNLSGPSIINAGAQILDTKTMHVVWEQILSIKDVKTIYQRMKKFDVPLLVNEDHHDIFLSERFPKKPILVLVQNLTHKKADAVIDELYKIPTIALHKVPSLKRHLVDVIITHAYATKQHGILESARILGIDTHEIIAVGDGYNDFPLFMAAGLRIAMGNAVPELKEIADYIAPSVENDGVAHVIEKFVLPHHAL